MGNFALPHQHGETFPADSLREHLSETERFQSAAALFKQLDDTNRLRIFWLLCHCEECVINISALTNMSSPAVSHHLRPLRSSGLITSRRVGKEVYYKAADNKQSHLLHQVLEKVLELTCPL